MSEKPAATPPANAGKETAPAAKSSPAAQAAVQELDAHELGERLRTLRGRVDELRGRL